MPKCRRSKNVKVVRQKLKNNAFIKIGNVW